MEAEKGTLVVTRSDHESIMVGDDIQITIVRATKGKARIAITAPKSIAVHRQEVYETVKAKEAANVEHL